MLTYEAEVWFDLDSQLWQELEGIQSAALRGVRGAYRGSSRRKVEAIVNVEPLDKFLAHLQAEWATRAVTTGNSDIRDFLESNPSPLSHHDDGRLPWAPRDPICRAFFLSEAPTGAPLSFGDCTDHRAAKGKVRDVTIFDPKQEDSKKASL